MVLLLPVALLNAEEMPDWFKIKDSRCKTYNLGSYENQEWKKIKLHQLVLSKLEFCEKFV